MSREVLAGIVIREISEMGGCARPRDVAERLRLGYKRAYFIIRGLARSGRLVRVKPGLYCTVPGARRYLAKPVAIRV